jgi:hypothetical protein
MPPDTSLTATIFGPALVCGKRGELAHVAKALDCDRRIFQAACGILEEILGNSNHTVASGCFASFAAVQFNWFAGDRCRRESVKS